MKARILATSILAAVVLDAASADACVAPTPEPHFVNSTLADSVAPDSAPDVSVLVNRGTDPERQGCGSVTSTSCDGVGSIQLQLNEPATDDQTAPEGMGYLIEVVSGAPPGRLSLPTGAIRTMNGTTLWFHWADDDTDGQEIIAFSVTLTPVDEAGNVGPSSDPIRIYDPGSAEGCAVVKSAASIDAALLLMAMAGYGWTLAALRRRAYRQLS